MVPHLSEMLAVKYFSYTYKKIKHSFCSLHFQLLCLTGSLTDFNTGMDFSLSTIAHQIMHWQPTVTSYLMCAHRRGNGYW